MLVKKHVYIVILIDMIGKLMACSLLFLHVFFSHETLGGVVALSHPFKPSFSTVSFIDAGGNNY